MNNQMIRTIQILCVTAGAAMAQSRGPLVIDLRTGSIYDLGTATPAKAAVTYTIPLATVRVQAHRACPETPFMARVDMNFNPTGQPPVTRAFITVAHEGGSTREPKLPAGFTTHVGDDLNNDGFGGGSSIDGVAEVQIQDQNLAVYSAGLSAGVVDRLAYQELRLAKGALRLEVANQYLGWGQPANEIATVFGKKLFGIGGSGADSRVYAGFNRVIRDGSTRTGCGARLAVIEFQ
jgi:hypothetical protein